MEMERKVGKMEPSTKGNGKIMNHMVKAGSHMHLETIMKVNGSRPKLKDRESFTKKMEIATKDSG